MGYRVIDCETQEDLRVFDSAYAAVDFMTSAWYRGDPQARRLELVDFQGQVLLGPDDLIGACAGEW